MRFQSTLLSWLTKARPGATTAESADGWIKFNQLLTPCSIIPFPITKTLSSAQVMTAGEDVQGSFTATRRDAQGTALNLAPWVDIPPGVWELDLEYSQILSGAVSDLTAFSQLGINIVDGGITRNHLIAELHGGQQQFQRHHRKLIVTVSKDIRTFLSLTHTTGLGTALNIARTSLIASRIL